jgi:pimeloyl-ACP methyl ester carboxylesterase
MHSVLTPEQALGPARRLDLAAGPVEVHEVGDGRPLLLVHGLMVHAAFWRKVVPVLAEHYRCLVPTLPLGAHRLPMNTDADLSPPGLGDLLADLLDALQVHDTVVVGSDTGGAYAQIMAAHHPDRLAGLVLTPCDTLEHFWPWHPTRMLRQAPVPRSILGYSMLARYEIPDEVLASYIAPLRHDERIRRDLTAVLAGIHPRHTRDATHRLRTFDRPVLLAWDTHDSLFPLADARHLARLLPHARLELIRNSATYIPEDQPDRLADLITDFLLELRATQNIHVSGTRISAPKREGRPVLNK